MRPFFPAFPCAPFRFTPNAAQRRFESICGGSFSALMLRMVFLSCRAASTDLPPSFSGFGSVIGCKTSASTVPG